MEQMEIKVTWRLVWAFYWRFALISFATAFVFYMLLFAFVGAALLPFIGSAFQ